ncbi:MAG: NUDIX domain-containing protein [Nanoarchaeota archaeon]|nr:NUDIX domain-containing protein [Nanoarchaeota archaeon]
MVKEALVVKKEILFQEKKFQGFLPFSEYDFGRIILENYEYQIRGDELENNENLKQVIPYVWLVNPKEKKIFAYKRASGKENYSEIRLMDKISCGVGGHIDREDSDNPIENAMIRELMEEVKMNTYPKPKIVGFLNDDSDSVGRVHLGIVALAETFEEVSKGDNEMVEGKFYSVGELEIIFSDSNYKVESWTLLSWPFVKEYLSGV